MGLFGWRLGRKPAPQTLGGAGGCCAAEHDLTPRPTPVAGRTPAQTYDVLMPRCDTPHCVYRLWMPHRECIVRP